MPIKAAKRTGKDLADTYQFWFRRKYNLSPRDPRFLEVTEEEVQAEYWAHFYAENAGKGEEYEDEDLDAEEIFAAMDGDDFDWETLINE